MNEAKDNSPLHIRPRPVEPVTIQIPKDALESLKKVAHSRDMSVDALLKFYIGQALRQDVAQFAAQLWMDQGAGPLQAAATAANPTQLVDRLSLVDTVTNLRAGSLSRLAAAQAGAMRTIVAPGDYVSTILREIRYEVA